MFRVVFVAESTRSHESLCGIASLIAPASRHQGAACTSPCEYEVGGNLTITDSLFSVDAALEGVGLTYTFEQLALPHIRAKKLKRVFGSVSPTFPGFYLYYSSRRQQPSEMKIFVDYALARSRKR